MIEEVKHLIALKHSLYRESTGGFEARLRRTILNGREVDLP